MTEEKDFETYLYLSNTNFQIFLFDKKKLKNLYKDELKFEDKLNFIDLNKLSNFLDRNIFKIENLIGKFIQNISLITESEENFQVNMSIKKNNDNLNNQKNLEHTLSEIKDLFKENYQKRNIMHMIINNYLINGETYLSFPSDLNSNNFCLEVKFISISKEFVFEAEKILGKYHIKIVNYLDGIYIKDFIKEGEIDLARMSHKIINGFNQNEIVLIPKNIDNPGFFEKFFQLFS